MNKIIDVHNLEKSYGDIDAVKDISFYVEEGKLFSFLGPNGAGKSTTIDILCTLLQKNDGEVSIDGHILGKEDALIRQKIGVVFQDNLLDPLLTVRENLTIRAGFYMVGKENIKNSVSSVVSETDIADFVDRPYGKLSGGQRRRGDMARALLSTPKILILDEPTTGLDPQTRKHIWKMIRKLQADTGMTIFLTTHYMEEAADSDYVIVIDDGKIAAKGTPAQLKETYARDVLHLTCKNKESLVDVLKNNQIEHTIKGNEVEIKLLSTLSASPILKLCEDYIDGFEVLRGTMDDAFIGITGKEIRK